MCLPISEQRVVSWRWQGTGSVKSNGWMILDRLVCLSELKSKSTAGEGATRGGSGGGESGVVVVRVVLPSESNELLKIAHADALSLLYFPEVC